MRTVAFLLSKHPYELRDGETAVSRLLMEAAAQSFTVRGIALTRSRPRPGPFLIEEVPKADLSLPRIVSRSVLRRRSAIHERFAPPSLSAAIRRTAADHLVARRLYMVEAALDAGRRGPDAPHAIAEVLESDVLRARNGALRPVLAIEARRTAADERRCLRDARSVIALSEDEARRAGAVIAQPVGRLDLAFPPERVAPSPASPTALWLGDRAWPPNLAGLAELYRLWPRIRANLPAAELLVGGGAVSHEPPPPAGARRLGFVEDLEPLWASSRVLLAPIPVGGGVRVKILEAVCRGRAVVGSTAALGSIPRYLPLVPHDDDDAFVSESVRLLSDGAYARRAGDELWEANAQHVAEGRLPAAVAAWLGGTAPLTRPGRA